MTKKINLKAAISNISIKRQVSGIPSISASNQNDMYFGIGYCHAMDRGLQMTMMKILGTGTGSEFLSGDDEMLEVDKFFRRMNWHSNIDSELEKLGKKELAYLQAYCDGANKAFAKSKPWELKLLLGYKDFNWKVTDIVILARMAGFLTLAQSQGEIERLFIQMVQKGVSREHLNELFPGILGDYDEELLKKVILHEKIVPDAIKWNIAASSFMASNNWVISGNKTKSGFPILANDPHLEINRLPSVWYELHVNCEGNFAQSATMPGIPSLLITRTKKLAWGATYSFMDSIDSWVEKCDTGKYQKDGEWHKFNERKEIIKRKKGKDVEITFYENEHGVLDGNPNENGYYLSTKWSGECSGAASLKAGLNMWNAQNVKEGMDTIGMLEASFCWVLADVDGNIGMQMSGLMPKRKDGWKGFVPASGWESENDWKGYHKISDLPRDYNPDKGFIITTNNQLNHLGNVSPINICMAEYRADRIQQLLEAQNQHEVAHSKKIHYDAYSLQAELFMPIIKKLLPKSENATILEQWDLCYDINSKGAYLFEMIYRSLYSEVFGKIMGKTLNDFLQNETGVYIDFYVNFDKILLSEKSLWFNGKTREELYLSAINKVIETKPQAWGDFNQITLNNMLLGGKFPKFIGFDKGPYPLKGGRATVHQGQVYRSAGRDTSFAPSYRIITDMSENIVYTNLSGGVSDRSLSKLYNNDLDNAMNGKYKKIVL